MTPRPVTAVTIFITLVASALTLQAQAPRATTGQSPQVKVLTPQDFWGEYAIWGSTGSDRSGKLYFGMTSNDDRGSGSAHLFELNPATGVFTDRGDVISQLERLRLRRPGETQMKIHSRIVEGPDGLRYFASMDESGEVDDGSRLPKWGGHLWRLSSSGAWEHLKATPEALIAVATGGPYVFALGYFNHVLYRFDTRSRGFQSLTVGSVGGHVSRNFFADDRGHAFVSRVTSSPQPTAVLVEYDENFKEIATFPLPEYFERGLSDSHGIVGISPDGNRGWYFTTGKGRLYHQERLTTGASKVSDEGWMDGHGPKYPASLFRDEITGTLYSAAMPSNWGGHAFEWIARRQDRTVSISPFPYGDAPEFPKDGLVYGSITRDAAGRLYVVGTMNYKPLVLQVTPAP